MSSQENGVRNSLQISHFANCVRELERCVESVGIVDGPLLRCVIGRQLSVIEGLYYLVATDFHWMVSESVRTLRGFDPCHILQLQNNVKLVFLICRGS